MRTLILLSALVCAGCAQCGASASEPEAPPAPSAATSDDDGPPTEGVTDTEETAERTAGARPARARTSAERAARARALPEEERARLRRRTELLGRGRQLGRAGDHEAALAAFTEALEIAPQDVTVQCEAGYQALQLERYVLAATHLELAVERAAAPRTTAMCLYNLGRVREAQDRPYDAWTHYRRSLELRPNRVVQARLDAIDAALDEEERRIEEEEEAAAEGFDTARVAGRRLPTLAALASAAGCGDDGWAIGRQPGVPDVPTPSAALREIAVYECDDDDMRETVSLLCARSDAGWAFVDEIARSDMGDMFGRLEATETVELRWEGPHLLVLVSGGYDEVDGEAHAYFSCEEEHADDSDAMDACLDEAMEGARPETWRRGRSYVLDGDALVSDPDPPDAVFAFEEADDDE